MMLSISHPMPAPPPLEPSPAPLSTMTASLPIIPTRQVSQRPKLSINTQQPRIIGKGASLRLETLSAVSPTVRNTFSNAYEHIAAAQPKSTASKPRLSIDSNISNANSASTPTSASTLSSTLTSASVESTPSTIPYKQPHNLVSILSNSPARPIISRKMTPARPMFPPEKRVSFRTPLEEEITTVIYTLAHSDLESSSVTLSSISTTESTESEESTADHSPTSNTSSHSLTKPTSMPTRSPTEKSVPKPSPKTKGPRTGDKRDSSSSEDDSDCAETPVAGRRKRRRDWRWTLGPLPGHPKSPSTTTSEATTSEDSN